MLGLIPKKFLQNRSRLVVVFLNEIESREIEIRLVKVWSDAYARLKLFFRLGIALLLNEKHTQIVERICVIRSQVDCGFQILPSLIVLAAAGV